MNSENPARSPMRSIALLGFDGAAALDISGPLEVFAMANHLAGATPPYKLVVLAERPGVFRTASGLGLAADAAWRDCPTPLDTLLVSGGPDMAALLGNAALLGWVRRMAAQTRRVGSICTGAFVLAAAGLLEGRRATTHWMRAESLARAFPGIVVDAEALHVRDGNVYTSAGVTAGMDLALALVEEDLGPEVALAVARMLVMFMKRPGGQAQFSTRLQAQATEGKRLAALLAWLADNYRQRMTVEDLAARALMSQRTFARVFVREVGATPAQYLERLRLEHAVRLLENGDVSVDVAARKCGFTSREQLRRAFRRHRGVTPREYRQRFCPGNPQPQEN